MNSGRSRLRADCKSCAGLCCVAPAFSASADFAIDKRAGEACPNLQLDFRCRIHTRLRQEGFPGCTVYDCFGAGQQVTQITFGGGDWRRSEIADAMFEVFGIMRQLHEMLWYLTEALDLQGARSLRREVSQAIEKTEGLTQLGPDALAQLEVAAYWGNVNALLRRASELERSEFSSEAIDRSGADLIEADLRGADLRGANLRGACLLGADLSGADLTKADLSGVDFRGANLRAANLTDSIFITQSQLVAARGDLETKVPASFTHPAHWYPPS